MFLYWLFIVLGFVPFHIISPYKVIGKKNIKGQKDFIIASNHKSNYDAVMLDYTFGKRIRFLAKKELFKTKLSSYFMKNVFGAISIDRDKGLTPSQYKQIAKVLKNNQKRGIFPEGTRNDKDEMEIKGGACYFAIKYKKPIVPCYIVSKHKFMKKNYILIGAPFTLSDFYDKKLDAATLLQADEVLLSKIYELKDNFEKAQNERKLVKTLKKQK